VDFVEIQKVLFKVLEAFADHHCLLHFLTSSQWIKETAIASFKEEV
jgi:hypothetical protein